MMKFLVILFVRKLLAQVNIFKFPSQATAQRPIFLSHGQLWATFKGPVLLNPS